MKKFWIVLSVFLFILTTHIHAEKNSYEMPDTLDLSVHAEKAINALTGIMDIDRLCEPLIFGELDPPGLRYDPFSFASSGPKFAESLFMMRLMTDCRMNTDVEQCYMDYLISCLGKDGLFYSRIDPNRPWAKDTSPEDWANIYGQARMLRSMLAISQVDNDPIWLKRMEKLVNTLKKIAIYKDDYAYYPTTPGYGDIFSYPKSGWKTTELKTGAQETMADLPDHSFGIPLYVGGLISPLVKYYERTGDKETIELADKLVKFLLKPDSGWKPDGCPQGVVPQEHGWFYGHFHAHTMCLRGLLDYAIATNNMKLKNLVRDGYQYARTFGVARLGWFEEYTGKASHETCGLANMTALAIKLTRAGVGEYWEDVDSYVRNQLIEAQFLSLTSTPKVKDLTPEQSEALNRIEGSFAGWGPPNYKEPRLMHCCLANGSQALYYVWDSIIDWDADTSQITINLLLNRRANCADIDSFLPYEGKVLIQNKKGKSLNVRLPAWVDKTKVKINIGNHTVKCRWLNNYLIIDGLKTNEQVQITFPMVLSEETHLVRNFAVRGTEFLGETEYKILFKGNTAVDILPKASNAMYPTYQRNYYLNETCPMKEGTTYFPTETIKW